MDNADLIVTADGWSSHQGTLRVGGHSYPCVLGRNGVTIDKREGDLKTPVGDFPLRRIYYRADREDAPQTGLPLSVISEDDGWCDDPAHDLYNLPVKLPFDASHERLWRDDHVYDLIVEIGWNDDPPVPGRGSAIFLHVARADGRGTEGCVALARGDLLAVLDKIGTGSRIRVQPPA